MELTIALAGNPNSGKTSLFNEITGATQKVGNWGGVTVEIKKGTKVINGDKVCFVDLPGTYSLSAYSEEERVALDYITRNHPDTIINVTDATNLERHLYLTIQLLEMGIRPVVALNMWDEVKSKGILIKTTELEKLLGLRVVTSSARTGSGVDELVKAAISQVKSNVENASKLKLPYPSEIISAVQQLTSIISRIDHDYPPDWLAIKLLEHDKAVEALLSKRIDAQEILKSLEIHQESISTILNEDSATLIAETRYGYIAGLLREVIQLTRSNAVEISDKIDNVLTHRFWAYPIFFAFMWLLFQATFKLGEYPMGWMDAGIELLMNLVRSILSPSLLRDLIVDGIITGVGGVIIFLPNIMILFFGISIMEDTGYMARAAFIMDRLMHRIGLHGKSFIPMLMGLGCSVPAIMAARTLESRNDRIKTILLTPLVACSARLPVFVLFAGAFFPSQAGNIVFLFQVVFGFSAFILMALLFKVTFFRKSEDIPFVMELPPYRLPTVKSMLLHMWQKAEHYLKKMGGVVLAFSILLWWAGVFPRSPEIEKEFNDKIIAIENDSGSSSEVKQHTIMKLETERDALVMQNTWIGQTGKLIEPIVQPFGSDWRGAVSLVTGFVAKEVVVSSMGVLYAVGSDIDEQNDLLYEKLRKAFSPLAAFSFMLFVLLYTPCIVALTTVIRELKSWRWSVFSVVYQLSLAWIAATVVFQIGSLIGFK
jgi:ferrous iron transport protein B